MEQFKSFVIDKMRSGDNANVNYKPRQGACRMGASSSGTTVARELNLYYFNGPWSEESIYSLKNHEGLKIIDEYDAKTMDNAGVTNRVCVGLPRSI